MLRRDSKSAKSKAKAKPKAKSKAKSKAKADRGVYVQKPGSNAYTGMLGVAVLALALGCVLLLWDWQSL